MVIQVVIRLTLYLDQALFKPKAHGFQHGIQNTVSMHILTALRREKETKLEKKFSPGVFRMPEKWGEARSHFK